ncbi:MAG: ABC transporter transmembrane domain-containing protein, partial [bacterium]|nr:ABC transporter transmembrane domain-containing protein [bacterium]
MSESMRRNLASGEEEKSPTKMYDARLVTRLTAYLRPYRPAVAVSVVLLIIHSLLAVTGPYLTKVAIDRYLGFDSASTSPLDPWLPEDPLAGLDFLALLYVGSLLAGFVARYFQTYVMHYTGQQVMRDLRLEIFIHLQRMGTKFFDRTPVGRLVTRVTSD